MRKILNFGSLNIDRVYKVDNFVKPGETKKAIDFEIYPGGKGLNQSLSVARAGYKIYHAGCIGKEGEFLKKLLSENGVDTDFVRHVQGESGHAVIQVNSNGENNIIIHGGANQKVDTSFIDKVLEKFSANDAILLQNEISNLDYIIDRAHEKNMTIILNPSPISEELKAIDFNKISIIILNETEGKEITGHKQSEKIIEYFMRKYPNMTVVLTLGSKGVIYSSKTQNILKAAKRVSAIDTTAAGDTFTGYFVAGILRGDTIETSLDNATRAAAICVTRKGAAESIPFFDEINSLN